MGSGGYQHYGLNALGKNTRWLGFFLGGRLSNSTSFKTSALACVTECTNMYIMSYAGDSMMYQHSVSGQLGCTGGSPTTSTPPNLNACSSSTPPLRNNSNQQQSQNQPTHNDNNGGGGGLSVSVGGVGVPNDPNNMVSVVASW